MSKTWRVVTAITTPDDWDAQDILNVIEPAFNGEGIDRPEPVKGLHATVEEMEQTSGKEE